MQYLFNFGFQLSLIAHPIINPHLSIHPLNHYNSLNSICSTAHLSFQSVCLSVRWFSDPIVRLVEHLKRQRRRRQPFRNFSMKGITQILPLSAQFQMARTTTQSNDSERSEWRNWHWIKIVSIKRLKIYLILGYEKNKYYWNIII